MHRTWFDLSRPRGKALLEHGGEILKVKKSWGSKKGAAIRLHTPEVPWDTLVMAEGIETTLTAMVSGLYVGAAFWAGIDLGNIAGRMQQGKGLRYAGLPDLSDADAFVPPPWVRQLVLIEDGDSGFVCDARDTDTLAHRIEALTDAALRETMGRRARAVVEPLTLDNMSQQLTELYASLLRLNGDNTSHADK